MDAKGSAGAHGIDVDAVVNDEVDARSDGKRVRNRGLRAGKAGRDTERRDQDGRDAMEIGQDAFFSGEAVTAAAAAAASAAAFLPCSIRALTFWPPFCPISS